VSDMGMEPATNMGLGSVCAFVTQRVDQKEKKMGEIFWLFNIRYR
jgi:hypothetical protein